MRAKHGHRKGGFSPTYNTWRNMMMRCTYPRADRYKAYGGRGIKVANKWKRFTGFLEDMGVRPSGRTIDRIDVDKGYNKANCRWATDKQQRSNKR